jgi:hypothetical protein
MTLEAQMSFGMGSNRRWTRQRIELAVISGVKFPIRFAVRGLTECLLSPSDSPKAVRTLPATCGQSGGVRAARRPLYL